MKNRTENEMEATIHRYMRLFADDMVASINEGTSILTPYIVIPVPQKKNPQFLEALHSGTGNSHVLSGRADDEMLLRLS